MQTQHKVFFNFERRQTTSPILKRRKNPSLVVYNNKAQNPIQNVCKKVQQISPQVSNFDDHKCFSEQNKNLISGESKDHMNNNKITIRPFCKAKQIQKQGNKIDKKVVESSQKQSNGYKDFIKQQSNTISYDNPQKQQQKNKKQFFKKNQNKRRFDEQSIVKNGLFMKDNYKRYSPFIVRKNVKTYQMQKNIIQLNPRSSESKTKNSRQQVKIPMQTCLQESFRQSIQQNKNDRFNTIIKDFQQKHQKRKRKFSLNTRSRKMSFESTLNRPIQIKSLQLSMRQPMNISLNRQHQNKVDVSKQSWQRIKIKKYRQQHLDKGQQKNHQMPNMELSEQTLRLGLYQEYLMSRFVRQQKQLKGWQVDNTNCFPQFI